jgi:hypothetical protein
MVVRGGDFTGNYRSIDLIAASTNALNTALLVRRPDHHKSSNDRGRAAGSGLLC